MMDTYNEKEASELRRKIHNSSIKTMVYTGAAIIGMALIYHARQVNSAPETIDTKAEGFAKNSKIVDTDFGTLAKILSVERLDTEYDSTVISKGEVSGIKYTLNGPFNVELTSGNDDATDTPIIRSYKGLQGKVTLVDESYK